MIKRFLTLSITLLATLGVWAEDEVYISTAKEWKFDNITLETGTTTQNIDGLCFKGLNSTNSSYGVKSGSNSGTYSDNTAWSTTCYAVSPGGSDLSNTAGERKALASTSDSFRRAFAFNASVPGTCYVIFGAGSANGTFNIYFNHKEDNTWSMSKTSVTSATTPTEVKMSSTTTGTFWISGKDVAYYVYAVRFVPESVTKPTISDDNGTITITEGTSNLTGDSNVSIKTYYTTDGNDPTTKSSEYDAENKPILTAGNTIKVISVNTVSGTTSDVVSYTLGATQYTLNVTAGTEGTVTVMQGSNDVTTAVATGADYDEGTVFTLRATASTGYEFVNWTNGSSVEVSTDNPYTISGLTENTTLIANFQVSSEPVELTKVPVILTAGQSNTDGRALNDSLPYYIKNQENSVYPNVYWSYGNGGIDKTTGTFDKYWPACDASSDPARWAYDAVVYYHLQKTLNGTPLYVIKESKGNTAINTAASSANNMWWSADETWLSTATSADAETSGQSLLLAFKDNIDKCLTTLAADGKEADIKFLMWHQGEADRGQGAAYQTQLQQVINYVRAYLVERTGNSSYANLPVILGGIKSTTAQYNNNVEAAKQAIAEADANIYYVSSEDFPQNAYRQDNLHFNQKGAELFGKRVYDLIATNDLMGDYADAYATKENNIYPPTITFDEDTKLVTITKDSDSDVDGTIYYTIDETTPTALSTAYNEPFIATQSGAIKAACISEDLASYAAEKSVAIPSAPVIYDFAAAKTNNETFTVGETQYDTYYYGLGETTVSDTHYNFKPVTSNTTNMPVNGRITWKAGTASLVEGGMKCGNTKRYMAIRNLYAGDRIQIVFTNGTIQYAKHSSKGDAMTELEIGDELTSEQEYTIKSVDESANYLVLYPTNGTIISQIYINREKYAVTFAEPGNGTLTIKNGEDDVESGATFYNGTVLDITATANDGYELDALTINDTTIDAEAITESSTGIYNYSLSVPAEATTVAVTFKAEAIVKSESVVYDFAAAEEITSTNTSGHSRNLTYVDQNSETQNNKGFRYQMENENHLRLLTYSSTGKFTQGTGVWLDGSNRPFAIEGLKKGDVIRIIHNGTVKNATLTDNGTTITDIEGNEFSDVIASGKEIKVSAASSTNDYAVFMAASSGLVISQIAINKGLKPRVVYDSYDEGTSTFTYNVSFYEGEVLHYKVDDGDETTVEYTTENNGTVSVAVGTGNLICWTTYDEVASDEVTTKVALPQVPVAEKTTDGTTSQVYTITFNEGETLHYTISYQSAEQTVEYTVENQGKVEVTVVGNGYIEFWTTIGSLTSEKGQQVIEGIHIEDDANTGKDDDAYNFKTWSSNVTTTGNNTNYYSLSLDKSEAVANVGEKDLYLLTNLYDNNVMMDLHGAFALSDEGVNSNERTIINIRKSYGLHTESSKTAYLSILNLKAGDNIKMVLNNDNDVSLLSTNAHLKGTGITPAVDGSTVWGKENTWVMDADGRLDLKFGSGSGQSYIQSITITSHETVTAGAITVDEANPNKITISQGTTDVEGNTVTTYYSLDGSEPTTELTENLEQELTASATIRTMTKSSTGKTASYIYSFVYQQPSASVAIDFQDAAEAGEELAFETDPTNVWEYASSTSPNQARADYYLLTNNSETLPIDGKISWRDPKDSKPTLESTGIKGNGYPFAIHDLAKNDEVIIVYSGTLTNATSTSGNSFSIDDTTVEAEANIPSGSTMKITSIGDHNTIVLKPGSNTVISAVYINHEVVVKLEKVSAPTVELRSGFTNRITITPGVSSYGSTVTTYYTTDGTTPTTESTPITGKTNIGPFTESITVKAYTVSETGVESSVSTFELVPPTFSVNLPTESEGGSVTADKTEAAEGETVRLTITLAEGYHLALLKVDNGAEVGTNNSFKMPASEVNITATFESDAESDPSEEVRENVTVIDEDNAKVTSVVIGSEATTVTISGSVDGVPVTSISNDVFTAANTEDVAAIDLSETAITLTGVRSEIAALQNISESTLVYLPSTANVTGTNVVTKSVDDDTYTCEDYQMTDGKEVAIPHEFTATEATMNRTFTANKKCTVCLPYAFKATGGTFYKFTGINNGKVQMTAQEDGSVLEANTPYIFEPSEGTTAITSQNVEVSIIEAPQTENTDAHFTFKGTYEKLVWESPVGIYGFAAQQQGMTEIGQFVRVGSGASIEACRAFLQYTGEDTLNGAESRRSSIILPNVMEIEWIKAGSQNTTAIDSMKSSVDNDDIPVYNMKGQRVDNSYKGLVIKNGKKVVKK